MREGGLDLAVWPHAAYERRLEFEADDFARKKPSVNGKPLDFWLKTDLSNNVPTILSGMSEVKVGGAIGRQFRVYNTVAITDSNRSYMGLIGKYYLTPFNEFIPLARYFPRVYSWVSDKIVPLSRGPRRFLFLNDGTRLAAYICYEEFIAAHARKYVHDGAQVLVAVSNDAYFGKSAGPRHHLSGSRLRSIENRRFLVRGASSGISAIVDPTGRIVKEIEVDQSGFAVSDIVPLDELSMFTCGGADIGYKLGAAIMIIMSMVGAVYYVVLTALGAPDKLRNR